MLLTRFKGFLKRVHGRLRRRYADIFLFASAVIIVTSLFPAFLPYRVLDEIYAEQVSSQIIYAENPMADPCEFTFGNINMSSLVKGVMSCAATVDEKGRRVGRFHISGVEIDFQKLLIWLIVVVFIWMTVQLLSRSGSGVVNNDLVPVQQKSRASFEMPHAEVTVEDALLIEAKNAWLTAQRFYGNSIYLLVSGVFMAFVGMGIFVFTVKDIPPESKGSWPYYVFATIRPFGLLIFIEAIAWFLLRQYRSSSEDFKIFHRIYLRRSNYFIARKAFSEISSLEKSRKIAQELLSEDLSGRLSVGQTTEAIEAMKMDENNPVFKLLSDALARATGKIKDESSRDPNEALEGKGKKKD